MVQSVCISFVGTQAVEMIQKLGFASNTSEAEAFGGKLIAAKLVKHVDETENTIKDDVFFYQFIMDSSDAEQVHCLSSSPPKSKMKYAMVADKGNVQNQSSTSRRQ